VQLVTLKKTLIACANKSGATEQVAKVIEEVPKETPGLEVELANLRKDSPNIAQYENIIVGAGVCAGKVYSEALDFLNQDFSNKKVAFFVCCGEAGDPKKYGESCTNYVTNVLAKFPNLKTVATEAFGGRMEMLGKTLFDNVDPIKVRF
jgi:menaquinone-dependent protoporphyrinogen oxidase